MRLLHLDEHGELSLTTYPPDKVPPYAILSHTWGDPDDEVTFQDLHNGAWKSKAGKVKIDFCLQQARKDGIVYFWIDTCCINKADQHGEELREAITSMFRWYAESQKCYVFLSDVLSRKRRILDGDNPGKSDLREARYWTRGWTLQELLAPGHVEFFSYEGDFLGDRASLCQTIHAVTKISPQALEGRSLALFTVRERWTWTSGRQTSRQEDQAYCLSGIFGVSLVPNYGEGLYAFERLKQAISFSQQNEIGKLVPLAQSAAPHSTISVPNLDHRKVMLDSLAFEQLDSRRSTIGKAEVSTCEWFLSHPAYSNWTQEQQRDGQNFFWLIGKPGAGKSTLMKFAHTNAEKTKSQDEIILSFFFNARGAQIERTTEGMYRSLLHQLFVQAPGLEDLLDDVQPQQWTVAVLCDLFLAALARLGKRHVRCFVDALDECSEEDIRDMVSTFEQVTDDAEKSGGRVCVCFASRHYPTIEITSGERLILEDQEGHDCDIVKYVQKHLRAGKGKASDEVKESIRLKANHVFLWVVLVVRILNEEFRKGRIFRVKQRLQELPPELGNLFKEILLRDNINTADMLLALQWILFAARPLSKEEFYYAMVAGLESDAASIGRWDPNEVTVDHMVRFVRDTSKGLAELTKSKKPTVQFIHESVRDYLIKENGLSQLWSQLNTDLLKRSHAELWRCCVAYLDADMGEYEARLSSLPKAKSTECKDLRRSLTADFPFMQYAVEHAWDHAEQGSFDSTPLFWSWESKKIETWRRLFDAFQQHDTRRHGHDGTLACLFAARGATGLLASLQPVTQIFRSCECKSRFPVLVAAARGHRDTVKEILNRYVFVQQSAGGSCHHSEAYLPPSLVECVDKHKRTILHWAAANDWADIAQLVLDISPATMQACTAQGEQPLHYASRKGSVEILEVLFNSDADIKAVDTKGWTAVHHAAAAGEVDTLKLLLTHSAGGDLLALTKKCETALHLASEHGKSDAVDFLISEGADLNVVDSDGRTALCIAADNGHASVVRSLLGADAEVNTVTLAQDTALSVALRTNTETIQSLLEGGADTRVRNHAGSTALHTACGPLWSNVDIVRLLVHHGANIHALDDYGATPLHVACRCDEIGVMQVLLQLGADIESRDFEGATPLIYACRRDLYYSMKERVGMLLEYGADVAAVDIHGRTALHYACIDGNKYSVGVLLEAGARTDKVDMEGLTPCDIALRHGEDFAALLRPSVDS